MPSVSRRASCAEKGADTVQRTDPIQFIKGVGPERAKQLASLGIRTVGDALDLFPRTYVDLTSPVKIAALSDGDHAVVRGEIVSAIRSVRTRKGMIVTSFDVFDGSETLAVKLFNRGYTVSGIEQGKTYLFYGKADVVGFIKEMNSPAIEELRNACLQPVYPLTGKLSQKFLRRIMREAVLAVEDVPPEVLPTFVREAYGFASVQEAYRQIHLPTDRESLKRAQDRFVFEELFLFSLGMDLLRGSRIEKKGIRYPKRDVTEFFDALPFRMTDAQMRAARDCIRDMMSGKPMVRLIQGDVGCGKTAVAAFLLYYTARCGHQACLMAPTEILAQQHYETLAPLLGRFGISCALLTGSTSKKKRGEILEALAEGDLSVLIGTHAVVGEAVTFADLAFCVTDEQHRFGVAQRSRLTEKGICPHVLVMSATPIPRTLSLILYGDMDVSVIDQLPPGRQKVGTFLVDSAYHARLFSFLHDCILAGEQAYIVCPLVEEGNDEELRSVLEFTKELSQTYLQDCRVAYVHGKMGSVEKNRILSDFASGQIGVLVSTTVIEVGINVPNASVMVVQNAERFGLSQLHQLRGRVGRGNQKAYCFLVSDTKSEKTQERLRIFCATNDGFEISRKDLELRGPGDFFGVRQSGLPVFRHADLMRDLSVMEQARCAAEQVCADPQWFEKEDGKDRKEALIRLFDRVDFHILS